MDLYRLDEILRSKVKKEKKDMEDLEYINVIGEYECKSDCCYVPISKDKLEYFKQIGYVEEEEMDWCLGGITLFHDDVMIIECPANKNFFSPVIEEEEEIIYMNQNKPMPFSLITNVFDYKKIKEEEKLLFDKLRSEENERRKLLRDAQIEKVKGLEKVYEQ